MNNEIIKKAQNGDRNAFMQIYDTYKDFVWSLTLSMTRNETKAQDVFQEVFITVYTKLKAFAFRSAFRTWLYRLVYNTNLNYIRKEARRSCVDIDAIPEPASPKTRGPMEAYDAVHMLLDNLSPEHRAVIVLRELQGLSYEEISSVTDIPIGTVQSRLYRAREVMKERLIQGGI